MSDDIDIFDGATLALLAMARTPLVLWPTTGEVARDPLEAAASVDPELVEQGWRRWLCECRMSDDIPYPPCSGQFLVVQEHMGKVLFDSDGSLFLEVVDPTIPREANPLYVRYDPKIQTLFLDDTVLGTGELYFMDEPPSDWSRDEDHP
jgi:hypothetical protein